VYRSRPVASTTVSVGSGNAYDVRYQNPNPTTNACKVKSIVNDVAGNLSSIFYDDVNIDWTPPTAVTTINDGKNSDINTVITSDSLSANWSSSKDPNSGISRYWYSIGTTPGAVNTLTWTSNLGDTLVTAKSLTLTAGQVYYFNVKSEDGAGLFSSVVSTNGQTVTVTTGVKDLQESNLVSVYPNPFTHSFEVSVTLTTDSDVDLAIVDALGKEVMQFHTKESKGTFTKTIDVNSLGLSSGNYFIKVKLNDKVLYKKIIKS
jgi:hypothetical protein